MRSIIRERAGMMRACCPDAAFGCFHTPVFFFIASVLHAASTTSSHLHTQLEGTLLEVVDDV